MDIAVIYLQSIIKPQCYRKFININVLSSIHIITAAIQHTSNYHLLLHRHFTKHECAFLKTTTNELPDAAIKVFFSYSLNDTYMYV